DNSWVTVAKRGRSKGTGGGLQASPGHRVTTGKATAQGKPNPGVIAVTTTDKILENGSWMRLTEVELEGLREIISPILSKTRVLNTFPTRGGLGVLVPDDRESTKIRAAIQQQTRGALVTKFVAKDELVLRIATSQDLQLGKDELEQQL
ncbi:hypothetical protein FOZ63_015094, partial [Perkinsus olseni]